MMGADSEERNVVWLQQPGVWQEHAPLGEKNWLWHSSGAPRELHDGGMKASTCWFSHRSSFSESTPDAAVQLNEGSAATVDKLIACTHQ